jgi:2-deoxy-D-gluconate 3-dehydrogenase
MTGKVGIVSGAGTGIGAGVALAVAELGAAVALIGRRADKLAEVAATIRDMGGVALECPCDATHMNSIAPTVASVRDQLGEIDFFVNSAGVNIQQTTLDVTEEAWDTVVDLNLKAAFFWSQAVAKAMIGAGHGGRIVHISSQMGAVGFAKRAVYAASKGGLVNMTRVLALELADAGIRVNCVGPTFVDTPLARKMLEDPQIAAQVMPRIPIGRMGSVDEVAAAVVYLLSPGADLVTGHHLLVDGGWTAQ